MSTDKLYVVIKRGLFWRPEDKGYTAKIEEAGRYTKEEAESRCHGGEQPVTMALASAFQTQESLQAEFDALRAEKEDANSAMIIAQKIASELRLALAASRDEAEKAKAELARLVAMHHAERMCLLKRSVEINSKYQAAVRDARDSFEHNGGGFGGGVCKNVPDNRYFELLAAIVSRDAARADAARKEPPAKAHGCEVGE